MREESEPRKPNRTKIANAVFDIAVMIKNGRKFKLKRRNFENYVDPEEIGKASYSLQ